MPEPALKQYAFRVAMWFFAAQMSLQGQGAKSVDWPVYGGQAAGDHYSSLTQINRSNVAKLAEAWRFDAQEEGGLETSPIVVGRVLYAYTATQKVIALDAGTGKLIWTFDSGVKGTQPARGVAYWRDGKRGVIFAGVMNFLVCAGCGDGQAGGGVWREMGGSICARDCAGSISCSRWC